jgi:hypothetical protein
LGFWGPQNPKTPRVNINYKKKDLIKFVRVSECGFGLNEACCLSISLLVLHDVFQLSLNGREGFILELLLGFNLHLLIVFLRLELLLGFNLHPLRVLLRDGFNLHSRLLHVLLLLGFRLSLNGSLALLVLGDGFLLSLNDSLALLVLRDGFLLSLNGSLALVDGEVGDKLVRRDTSRFVCVHFGKYVLDVSAVSIRVLVGDSKHVSDILVALDRLSEFSKREISVFVAVTHLEDLV